MDFFLYDMDLRHEGVNLVTGDLLVFSGDIKW